MIAKIRHIGIPVRSLKQATEFWEQKLNLVISQRSLELWDSEQLHIVKLRDFWFNHIELVKGDWPYHVAVTVTELLSEEFEKYMVHYRDKEDIEIAIYKIPAIGFIELVREKKPEAWL